MIHYSKYICGCVSNVYLVTRLPQLNLPNFVWAHQSSNKSELANKWAASKCSLYFFFDVSCGIFKMAIPYGWKEIVFRTSKLKWSEQIFYFSHRFFSPIFILFYTWKIDQKSTKTYFKMCIFYYHWALLVLLYHTTDRATAKTNAVVSPVDIYKYSWVSKHLLLISHLFQWLIRMHTHTHMCKCITFKC